MVNAFLRKLFIFFKSMKCGITLLIMVMALSILGTVIPQGFDEHFYGSKYHPLMAKLVLSLDFDNIFSSTLFGILFAALSINLIMCSTFRLGSIINKLKSGAKIDNMNLLKSFHLDTQNSIDSTLKDTFKSHGFYGYKQSKADANSYFAIKYKTGYFGSWMLHFGILLVIIFYGYGHVTFFSEALYGVSGSVQAIAGTEYRARIQDFAIEYCEDGSVQQYTSKVELLDEQNNSLKSSTVSVNNPMRFKGYTFYQTSYGWAAKCRVIKSGSTLMEDTIYEKTSLNVPNENVGIYLNRFYPDFAASSEGMASLSDEPKNPVVLYAVHYMGEIVKMDVLPIGEAIKWNDYEFILESPQRYTYLNVNKMKGQLGAGLGALLIMAGLMLVFYLKPVKMTVKLDGAKLLVYGDRTLEKNMKLLKGER
jgi:cytochrome c biogenesis protein